MAMPRFHVPPEFWQLERLRLEGEEAHHARDVLRMQAGERLVLFNGQGHEATAEIVALERDRIELRLLQHSQTPPLKCEVTLAQAIPKGKNMDLIVEKATELGASAIAPLSSERTIVQLDPDEAERKREKWQRVAIEAAKQCGQNWLPRIAMPVTVKTFFETTPKFDLMLIASLQPDARHLKTILAELSANDPQRRFGLPSRVHTALRRVLVLVGPEGDFTPAEMSLAKSAGCRPMTLGPVILRTETAAIYCLSVLSHELFAP